MAVQSGRPPWTIVLGLAGVVVMISMLMLGGLTLVREREQGSWETLLATPVDAIDALMSKLSPYIIIGAMQTGRVIGGARLLFFLPLRGDVIALLRAVPLVFRRPPDPGIGLPGFSQQSTSGNPGCSVFLSSVDAPVRLYVPVPGNAAVGPGNWGRCCR
jgi:ABC-type Na+ efflux pump permease subunit